MKPLRVLLINTASTGYNGITSVMFRFMAATRGAVQYDVLLAGRIEPHIETAIRVLGARMLVPPVRRLTHPLAYSKYLTRLIRTEGYDAVHVHGNSGTMAIDIRAVKRGGARIRIAHCHNSSCRYRAAHRLLKGRLYRDMTAGVYCSDAARDWLFPACENAFWLANGIDPAPYRFSPSVREAVRRELGLTDRFVVGHIGRFVPEKNHTFLLQAFSRLRERRPEAALLLIGDGPERAAIEAAANAMGQKERVVFLHARGDTERLYPAMDVFALPSLYEGLPVTLIEAQASGLPCVVSDAVTQQANALGLVTYADIGDADAFAALLADAACTADARIRANDAMQQTRFSIFDAAAQLLRLYRDEPILRENVHA